MRKLIYLLLFPLFSLGQTTPANFHYTDVERTFVSLKWDAVSGVDGYRIYKDAVEVGTITGTEGAVTGLTTETDYDFSVSSFIGVTESALSTLPNVRTGLYPDEELIVETAYTTPAVPSNTTPYTNDFGLEERKVSQRSVEGDVPEVEKGYAKQPLWNKDGTELRTQIQYDFYNGNTYVKESDRTISNVYGYWDDNRSIRLNENKFQVRTEAGALTTIRTFSEYDNISIAPTSETQPSWDGDKWALQGVRSGQMYMFTYTASTDTKHGEVAIPDVEGGWTGASPYGNYAVALIQTAGDDTLLVYDFETLAYIGTDVSSIGHSDFQVTIQGNEVLAGRLDGTIRMYKLSNPSVQIPVLGTPGDTFDLGHASGKNINQTGWLFVDDRTTAALAAVTFPTHRRVYRKIIAVCLDENKSGYTEVLTRTYGRLYLEEINSFVATPDPSGQKVGFNNFSNSASYSNMELYVAQRVSGENTIPNVPIISPEVTPLVSLVIEAHKIRLGTGGGGGYLGINKIN